MFLPKVFFKDIFQVLDLSLRVPERPVGVVEGFPSCLSSCNETLSMKT